MILLTSSPDIKKSKVAKYFASYFFLLALIFHSKASDSYSTESVSKLAPVINSTLSYLKSISLKHQVNHKFIDSKYSSICQQILLTKDGINRTLEDSVLCKKVSGIVYIENSKINTNGNLFILFPESKNQKFKSDRIIPLPPIKSIRYRKPSYLQMGVVLQKGAEGGGGVGSDMNAFQNACPSIYDGTLHIFGRVTVHNHFHAIQDNLLPYYSQIVLDGYINPRFLFKKRALYIFDQKIVKYSPVMEILFKSFDDVFKINEISGKCFRRVIYGNGPRLFYNPSMYYLRYAAGALLRSISMYIYNINDRNDNNNYKKNPFLSHAIEEKRNKHGEFNNAGKNCFTSDSLFDKTCPLNIVIYSRGLNVGYRSLAAENLLCEKILSYGARVIHFLDYSLKELPNQISVASFADISIGLHGAGLVNVLFQQERTALLELKTHYGYTSDLFALAADARLITNYHINSPIKYNL